MTLNERRQHTRFNVEQNVFLTVRPEFKKIGRVKDISPGGICFEYAVFGPHEKFFVCEVDILSEGGKFHFLKVPCRVAYDVQCTQVEFQQIQMRRCGLMFDGLPDSQTNRIINAVLMAELPKMDRTVCPPVDDRLSPQ